MVGVDAKTVFTLFFAVQWTTAFATLSRYHLFDGHLLATDKQHGVLRRLGIGVVLLVIFPIALFIALLWLIPDSKSWWPVALAALAPVALFSLSRFVHAWIASEGRWERYYEPPEYEALLRDWRPTRQPPTGPIPHVVEGMVLLTVGVVAAFVASRSG